MSYESPRLLVYPVRQNKPSLVIFNNPVTFHGSVGRHNYNSVSLELVAFAKRSIFILL